LPRRYIKELRKAGVHIHPFGTTQGRGNRSAQLQKPPKDNGGGREGRLRGGAQRRG
jgi:hypothetical protein